ncbi:hypothetical protein C8A01DRAFT_48263 [Parachaetomium inaequale]|uniref:Uncharacterized protein n=1 Tax=Parachaetomium inaequale TaxID=2588326 RepID=A0AAN6PF30_9PEZI|nr:hypothetical protein C8A01DRAFT_48263 [Parachaetomium inaequale]
MARHTCLLAVLGAITPAAILAQLTTTTSASETFDLFVMNPTGSGSTPSIYASIISVNPTLSETAYYISCPLSDDADDWGRPQSAPCNYIGGASVTINPTAMTLRLRRESQLVSDALATGGPDETRFVETFITVSATATCDIHGSTSASCSGFMTSMPTTGTYSEFGSSTWGVSSTTEVETISTQFADVSAHRIPVSITAGLAKLSTSTTSSTTRSSTGAAARVTGVVGQVAVAGVVALAGGVALI